MTTKPWLHVCAKLTTFVTNIATSRRQASSKYGSTKPSVARGFYSKPHVGEIDSQVPETREERSTFGCAISRPRTQRLRCLATKFYMKTTQKDKRNKQNE